MKAPKKVNVTFAIREPIRAKIEAGIADINMFDGAQQHAYKLFNQNNFIDYLWSSHFQAYLDDISSGKMITTAMLEETNQTKQLLNSFRGTRVLTTEETKYYEEFFTLLESEVSGVKRTTKPFSNGVSFLLCFTGKDMLEWFKKNMKIDKSKAGEICNTLISQGYIYSIDPIVFNFGPSHLYHMRGTPHYYTEREMIEVSSFCLKSILKLYARRGWTCVVPDWVSKISKRKQDQWMVWKCQCFLDLKKNDAFSNLWKCMMGLSALPSIKLLDITKRTIVCSYNVAYPGVPSNVEFLSCLVSHRGIVDPTNTKETIDIMIETSIINHEKFNNNSDLPRGHVMHRGLIVEHTDNTTTLTYIDLSDVGMLKNYAEVIDKQFRNILNHVDIQTLYEISDSPAAVVDHSTTSTFKEEETPASPPPALIDRGAGHITSTDLCGESTEDSPPSHSMDDSSTDHTETLSDYLVSHKDSCERSYEPDSPNFVANSDDFSPKFSGEKFLSPKTKDKERRERAKQDGEKAERRERDRKAGDKGDRVLVVPDDQKAGILKGLMKIGWNEGGVGVVGEKEREKKGRRKGDDLESNKKSSPRVDKERGRSYSRETSPEEKIQTRSSATALSTSGKVKEPFKTATPKGERRRSKSREREGGEKKKKSPRKSKTKPVENK
eukprot:TRINITY_DN5398_c0_g1_i1.p1 TRINITY_DN5398_c0_g1~~TRINITY_DN5398_c0_g1_i1.p1  ORF type:complete len:746 (+),score=145.50 TRINITY_DN5398_c0_g1_i1:248-2239(+)